jgi:hypothetical protein
MGKRTCKFMEELKRKYSCFRNGRDEWEAECLVCKQGTCVSVANKGALELRNHVEREKHTSSLPTKILKPLLPLTFPLFYGR